MEKTIKEFYIKTTCRKWTNVISYMEETYPEMTSEFKTIQREQYELFCRKQYDYVHKTLREQF